VIEAARQREVTGARIHSIGYLLAIGRPCDDGGGVGGGGVDGVVAGLLDVGQVGTEGTDPSKLRGL
jgi:hypothetical protein